MCYVFTSRLDLSSDDFSGTSYNDLAYTEVSFDLHVTVLALQPDGMCTVKRRSGRSSGTELFLNECERHFSLVTDPDAFTQSFLCTRCLHCFTRLYNSSIHQCIGSVESKRRFVEGAWELQPGVFEHVQSLGLATPDMVYPNRITYDIECFLSRKQLLEGTDRMKYTSRHELLSVSVCSNVLGYDTLVCLIRSGTMQELVYNFVDKLETIACRVEDLLSERLGWCFAWSASLAKTEREEVERACQTRGSKEDRAAVRTMVARRVLQQLLQWIRVVQVVGFNSQRYKFERA